MQYTHLGRTGLQVSKLEKFEALCQDIGEEPAIVALAWLLQTAGMTKDVVFEPVEGPINDRIDEAYRAKYAGSPYVKPMIGARARAAAVRVLPRG